MLKGLEMEITRDATIIDFEGPNEDEEAALVRAKQFALEYSPSHVSARSAIKTAVVEGLPRCSSEILFWRITWEHDLTTPPEDFAIWRCSRN